jgi:uncharacterized membrane protein
MTEESLDNQRGDVPMPMLAPCRKIGALAPLAWLKAGWGDIRRAPRQSLSYGLAITALSYLVSFMALELGNWVILLALLSGFVFIGPVMAIGLYAISAQLQRGEHPSLARCFKEERKCVGNAMVFALLLMVIFLVWARAASMLHIFFPIEAKPDWGQVLAFYGIGSAVGSIFAVITFSIAAFSLPMILDRQVDAVTAVITSINAVLRNKPAMAVWIALIVLATALGFATAFLGLAITIPLIGHATWHGYQATINAGAFPPNDPTAGARSAARAP